MYCRDTALFTNSLRFAAPLNNLALGAFRMTFRNYIRILQFVVAIALCIVLLGFTAMVFSDSYAGLSHLAQWLQGIGFLLLFLAAPFLVKAKCPSCGRLFCGPQDEYITHPNTNVFTSSCKYCGFSINHVH